MTRLNKTIVLVGLMGAGKTSVGRRLAEMLSVAFFDSDDEIEAAAGMTIPDIFETFGEEDFRRGERDVLQRLMTDRPCVLATGGGAFMHADTRAIVAEWGVSVWLQVDLDLLWHRVADRPGRPLLANDDPFGTLKRLFDTRAPVYAQADVTVASHRRESQDDVARHVIEAVAAFGQQHPDRAAFGPMKGN